MGMGMGVGGRIAWKHVAVGVVGLEVQGLAVEVAREVGDRGRRGLWSCGIVGYDGGR